MTTNALAYRPDNRRQVFDALSPMGGVVLAPVRIPSFSEAFAFDPARYGAGSVGGLRPSGLSRIGSKRQEQKRSGTLPSLRPRNLASATLSGLHLPQAGLRSTAPGLPRLRSNLQSPTFSPTLPLQSPLKEPSKRVLPATKNEPVKSPLARESINCKERPKGFHPKRAGGSASRAFIPWCERRT